MTRVAYLFDMSGELKEYGKHFENNSEVTSKLSSYKTVKKPKKLKIKK